MAALRQHVQHRSRYFCRRCTFKVWHADMGWWRSDLSWLHHWGRGYR